MGLGVELCSKTVNILKIRQESLSFHLSHKGRGEKKDFEQGPDDATPYRYTARVAKMLRCLFE